MLGIRQLTSDNLLLNTRLLSKQNPSEPNGNVWTADAVHPFLEFCSHLLPSEVLWIKSSNYFMVVCWGPGFGVVFGSSCRGHGGVNGQQVHRRQAHLIGDLHQATCLRRQCRPVAPECFWCLPCWFEVSTPSCWTTEPAEPGSLNQCFQEDRHFDLISYIKTRFWTFITVNPTVTTLLLPRPV